MGVLFAKNAIQHSIDIALMLNYHTEKYGDRYIYPKSLAYENPKSANKYTLKSSINFKPSIHNALATGISQKKNGFLCAYWLC